MNCGAERRTHTYTILKMQDILYATAFDGNIPGHQITTDHMNINQVVEAIAAAVGISISADDRSVLRRWFDRCAVQCGSIRWPGSTF